MNRNIEADCGKAQSKTQGGIKGMSLGDIEKLISEAVASNSNLSSEFDRIKKGKLAKGVSRRILYCKFMKAKLGPKWAQLTGKKNSPTAAKSPPKGAAKSPIINQFNAENFPFVLETEEGPAEPTNENDPQIENIYNTEFEAPRAVPYVRESRKKEQDPLSGKPSPAMMAKIDAMIKRAKARGETLPEFKSTRNKLMWSQTFKPKNGPPKPTKKPAIKRKEKPPRAVMAPVSRMKINGGNGRVPTKSKVVLATGTKLSKSESREATKLAEQITDKLTKLTKSNTNGLRRILLNRYAAGNANATLKKLQNLNTFNYAAIRNVMRGMEFERAKVLKNLGRPIAPPSPVREVKQSFSMVPMGTNVREIARRGRAKKVANQTTEERRAIRIVNALNKMKARTKASQPAVKMFVTQRAPNLNSNSNEENVAAVEVKSIGSSVGSNVGSAGGSPKRASPKTPRKLIYTEAKKVMEEAAAKPLKRPVPRVVRNIKMGTVKLENLNKNKLVTIAKQVYAIARPGDKIPFEQANKNKLQKLIQLGIKKL